MVTALRQMPHCAACQPDERLSPEQLAADPRFGALDLFDEIAATYGLTATFDLWGRALPIWRERYAPVVCDRCNGTGVVFDHSSLDPQQRWDDTCSACAGAGITARESAA